MTLSEYVRTYCLEHDLTAATIEQYSVVAKQFDEFCRKPLELVVAEDANRFIMHMLETLARTTVKNRRGALGVLLRAAAADNLCAPLGKIRVVKVPQANPDAYTRDELAKLLDAVKIMRGWYANGIRRRDWWRAYLQAKYDSGLRVGDMLCLEWTDIWPDGTLVMVQNKTGHSHKIRFESGTLEAMERIKPYGGALIFPWHACREAYFAAFRRLRKKAGVKGSAKWIRRAGATHVAMEHGTEAATKFLGHRSGDLAVRHYIDARQVGTTIYKPQPLMWRE